MSYMMQFQPDFSFKLRTNFRKPWSPSLEPVTAWVTLETQEFRIVGYIFNAIIFIYLVNSLLLGSLCLLLRHSEVALHHRCQARHIRALQTSCFRWRNQALLHSICLKIINSPGTCSCIGKAPLLPHGTSWGQHRAPGSGTWSPQSAFRWNIGWNHKEQFARIFRVKVRSPVGMVPLLAFDDIIESVQGSAWFTNLKILVIGLCVYHF